MTMRSSSLSLAILNVQGQIVTLETLSLKVDSEEGQMGYQALLSLKMYLSSAGCK